MVELKSQTSGKRRRMRMLVVGSASSSIDTDLKLVPLSRAIESKLRHVTNQGHNKFQIQNQDQQKFLLANNKKHLILISLGPEKKNNQFLFHKKRHIVLANQFRDQVIKHKILAEEERKTDRKGKKLTTNNDPQTTNNIKCYLAILVRNTQKKN